MQADGRYKICEEKTLLLNYFAWIACEQRYKNEWLEGLKDFFLPFLK